MTSAHGPGRRLGLLVVAAALALAGCASIPDGGRVHTVPDAVDDDQGAVRYTPAGPTPGASPTEVVQGYLDAQLAFPSSTAVASQFLTRDAAQGWRSGTGTRVYTTRTVRAEPTAAPQSRDPDVGQRATVRVAGSLLARLGPTGRYQSGGELDETFALTQVGGQWRIATAPDGVLVSQRWFEDYVRPFEVFFFDRTGERLVPDVVHLALGDQLATSLVAALAAGPGPGARTLRRTYLPAARTLRPSVPVGPDDVADVQFAAPLDSLPSGRADRLAAQVTSTLAQVDGLTGVRINGGAVTSSDGQPVIDLTDGDPFGPAPASTAAYAVVDDRLSRLDADRLRPVGGPWGRSAGPLRDLAVGDSQAAAVQAGQVRVVPLDSAGRGTRVDSTDPEALAWDVTGRLWVADRPGGTTRLRTWVDGESLPVDVAGLDDVEVRSMAVSPDAGRLALTVRREGSRADQLWVVPLGRGRGGAVTAAGSPARLADQVRSVRDAGWFDGSTIELLGGSDRGLQVRRVAVDGSGLTDGVGGGGALLPDLDALALARGSSSDPPRWVIDRERRLWYQAPSQGWVRIRTAATALTAAP